MWYERNVMCSVLYTLLKVVKIHCNLSVLAVSLMGFQKNWIRCELYPIFF